jgi:hypothetical protein
MCDPVSIGMGILAVSSMAMEHKGQSDLADAQSDANKVQAESARDAYRSNLDQTIVEQDQEKASATQSSLQQRQELMKAQASARTAAGESGISGLSVDDLLNDLDSQGLDNMNSIEANYISRSNSIGVQRKNAYANAASTINGLKIPVEPNAVATGLKMGSAGLQAYSNAQTRRGSR